MGIWQVGRRQIPREDRLLLQYLIAAHGLCLLFLQSKTAINLSQQAVDLGAQEAIALRNAGPLRQSSGIIASSITIEAEHGARIEDVHALPQGGFFRWRL